MWVPVSVWECGVLGAQDPAVTEPQETQFQVNFLCVMGQPQNRERRGTKAGQRTWPGAWSSEEAAAVGAAQYPAWVLPQAAADLGGSSCHGMKSGVLGTSWARGNTAVTRMPLGLEGGHCIALRAVRWRLCLEPRDPAGSHPGWVT